MLMEFREQMNAFWEKAALEGAQNKDPQHSGERLRSLYYDFDATERAVADQVICEWLAPDGDPFKQNDALDLIERFKLVAALPALREYAKHALGTYAAEKARRLTGILEQLSA